MRFPPVFDEKERAILFAMYEEANGYYDSYTLAWKLNPAVKLSTPEAETAFTETRDATERLIERGFVRVPCPGPGVPLAGGRSYVRARHVAGIVNRLGLGV